MTAADRERPRARSADRFLRIAMVVYGGVGHDSRVQREALTLADAGHAVTIFCLGGSVEAAGGRGDIRVIVRVPDRSSVIPETPSPFHAGGSGSRVRDALSRIAWLRGYVRNLRAWGAEIGTLGGPFDVWHAHDFAALVAISRSERRGAALIYDVHDIFTETGTGIRLPRPFRWFLRAYERRLVRRVDLVVTVNDGLAEVIRRQCRPRSMVVVHNCAPAWASPTDRPDLIRRTAGIPLGAPVVLYHGLLTGHRGIERLCEALVEPGLESVHLALLGYGQRRETYRELAAEPRFGGRIHVLDPVPPAELLPWVASADAGVMAFPPSTRNLYLSTPNKLFECLAAGVPVVVSDFPDIRRIVLDDPLGPLGVTCDPTDVHDVARALRAVLVRDPDAREDLRRRCATAARDRWNWESQAARLLDAYDELGVGLRARAAGTAR